MDAKQLSAGFWFYSFQETNLKNYAENIFGVNTVFKGRSLKGVNFLEQEISIFIKGKP